MKFSRWNPEEKLIKANPVLMNRIGFFTFFLILYVMRCTLKMEKINDMRAVTVIWIL
ncbi:MULTISPECIES: hypothetical protein [Paenibacillus]|uniref:hypothetical protein n=1 Tax=Paenibacillus TaxID=44249 RepID=UPI000897E310|nr:MULTISPECIES: hypothetical protein [Paenibacillus]WDQ33455.1 hypothetical protein PTQ21_03795 [Paenibacillus marchantiae]SEB19773.1 hypothetical protein SAMN03159332_4274 [Paenibacillus sp. 276b]SHN68873.1 hypothetical protein SAMN04487896_2507 [Paenibacillus sp. ov031]